MLKVMNEENKDVSMDEIQTRIQEVFSNPGALVSSFYPPHLSPPSNTQDVISEYDPRTFEFLSKLSSILE
jgi:hypothetical protein